MRTAGAPRAQRPVAVQGLAPTARLPCGGPVAAPAPAWSVEGALQARRLTWFLAFLETGAR